MHLKLKYFCPLNAQLPMPSLTFITGGARSGKSAFAQRLATERAGDAVLYIATWRETEETARDTEAQRRIARHRASRPTTWTTLVLEDELNVIPRAAQSHGSHALLLDCLSLYISGTLFMHPEPPVDAEDAAADAVERLLNVLRETDRACFIVSNEVGLGIAPDNALARAYRDALGRANQIAAAAADEAFLMAAGLAVRLK
jgi:adenosylcobinamide kinase / adenosylcobinamide-phosphate guanylyltransferase